MTELEIAKFVADQKLGIGKLLKGAKDELSNLLDDGVHNYLENQRIKYSRMKTFLFRNETVEFEKIYFPLNLQSQEIEEDEEKIVEDPFKLIKDERNITIIGEAGSGKSMLMVNIFIQCIKTRYKIPIIVELRNLKYYQLDILKYVQDYILDNQIKPNSTILDRALKSGRFIFLFDGYDEIDSESIGSVTNGLISFVDKYPNNEFVLTSRPGTGVENLKRFRNWFVNPLETRQIENFIDLQVSLMRDSGLGMKMKVEISKTENAQFLHFLRNPLLLSMFIFTFRFNPELPKTKSKFYWNVFDTLSTKHDSITKGGGYLHSRKCGLSLEEIETVLMWFSYISFFEENFSFEEVYLKKTIEKIKDQLKLKFNTDDLLYDLKVNISILIQDGLELRFPHRSLQEYFAALLISKQNELDREKIYSNKIPSIFISKKRTNFSVNFALQNFFTICYELDKEKISKNLFLPILKNIVNKIRGNQKPIDYLKNIFDYVKPTYHIILRGNKDSHHIGISSFIFDSIDKQVLDFFDIWNLISVTIFEINFDAQFLKKYAHQDDSDSLTIDICDIYNNEVKKLIETNNTELYIKKIIKKIETITRKVETELVNSVSSTTNLLGI